MQDVDEANGPDADHVSESDASSRVLSVPGLSPQLNSNFADLADTGRPDWMSHRKEPAGWADRYPSADIELTGL